MKNKPSALDKHPLHYEDIPPDYRTKKVMKNNLVIGPTLSVEAKDLPKKSKKVLTSPSIFARMKPSSNNTRKDDTMASQDKTKSEPKAKGNKLDVVKSVAWLIEAAFRGFTGWVLLTNFDNMFTTAAAFYALGTAAVIVVMHFVRAHK